jgi:hypothetical protein
MESMCHLKLERHIGISRVVNMNLNINTRLTRRATLDASPRLRRAVGASALRRYVFQNEDKLLKL